MSLTLDSIYVYFNRIKLPSPVFIPNRIHGINVIDLNTGPVRLISIRS
jgi:hypothetical protein